jgi:hypothetical protein
MIKFFRRIRQDLIANGKTSKYFKYAFGEIALVMIGILLALQVSNWNDIRKERNLEKRYLSELVLDLKTDSIVISNFIAQSNIQIKNKYKLLEYINEKLLFPKDSLALFFNNQWQITYSFNPITTTLDEMKSTGNIGVIQNSDLRRKILETYNNYTIHINQHQNIYDEQQGEIWKLLFSTVPNLYTGNIEQSKKTDIKTALSRFEVQNRINGNYVIGFNEALHQLQSWNTNLLNVIREESNMLNY